ncbi:hypothetical protein ES708_10299 [subsurface metagenome]
MPNGKSLLGEVEKKLGLPPLFQVAESLDKI